MLNREYAIQIARDWNTKEEGYGARFRVRKVFLDGYQVQQVGAAIHLKYWIPAEERSAFNSNVVGEIEVVDAFIGTPPE